MFKDNALDVVYSIHYVGNNTASVGKTTNSGQQTGTIYQSDDAQFYDALTSFIVNAKHNTIQWGCGKLGLVFPNNMPPRDLSFLSYLKHNMPNVISRFKSFLVITFMLVFFPYSIAMVLFSDGDENNSNGLFYIMIISVLALFPCLTKTEDMPLLDVTRYILLELYAVGIFLISAIYFKYNSWKGKWTNENNNDG